MKLRTITAALLFSFVITGCGTGAGMTEIPVNEEGAIDEGITEDTETGETAKEEADAEGDTTELIWWVYTPDGTPPDDYEEVLAKANDMTFSCDWCNDFDRNAGSGYYYDITDLVKEAAPGLYEAVDPWWDIGTLKGKI